MVEKDPQYLTTREVAKLLRLNEKKVYALVRDQELPAARVSGKWLFPKVLVERWVDEHTVTPLGGFMGSLLDRLIVMQGSDDTLLNTVLDKLREERALPIVTANVGSLGGLRAVDSGLAHLAGFHVDDSEIGNYSAGVHSWYTFSLGLRDQGLVYRKTPGSRLADLSTAVNRGLCLAVRQPESGTYRLTQRLFAESGLELDSTRELGPFKSHLEVGVAVRGGLADFGIANQMAADLCGLEFEPLVQEVFKLAVPARYMSHGRISRFLELLLSELGALSKKGVPGYSFEVLGQVCPYRFGASEEA